MAIGLGRITDLRVNFAKEQGLSPLLCKTCEAENAPVKPDGDIRCVAVARRIVAGVLCLIPSEFDSNVARFRMAEVFEVLMALSDSLVMLSRNTRVIASRDALVIVSRDALVTVSRDALVTVLHDALARFDLKGEQHFFLSSCLFTAFFSPKALSHT